MPVVFFLAGGTPPTTNGAGVVRVSLGASEELTLDINTTQPAIQLVVATYTSAVGGALGGTMLGDFLLGAG